MNKNNNFSSINSFFQFKNIFKYTLLITIFIFLSKLTALIRDLSFSFKFGSESEIEIFFLNFNLFSLFSGIFLNSLIFYLVPLIKPQKKIIDFYSLNIAFFLKLSIYFSLILFSIFFLIYNFEIIEISELVKKGANRNYFIFCLCFPIISLCFVFTAMMTSKNQHHCLIYDSIPNLALIISTLLFVYNEYLLSISFLIGVLIQFLILNIFNRYSIKKVFFYFFSNKTIVDGFFIIFLTQIILATPHLIDHFLVSSMKAKLLAQYSYVFKLYSIIYTFLFLIVSRLFINYFSSEDFILTKKKYIYFTIFFFFLFLISFFISKYSFFINKIIFLRGNFNYEDLESVSEIFSIFSYLLPFYLFNFVCITYFFAKKKIKIVMAISIFIIFFKVLYLILINNINVFSLPLSNIFGYSITLIYTLKKLNNLIKD